MGEYFVSISRKAVLAVAVCDIVARLGFSFVSPLQAFVLYQLWALVSAEGTSNSSIQTLIDKEGELDTDQKIVFALGRFFLVGVVYGLCRLAIWVVR